MFEVFPLIGSIHADKEVILRDFMNQNVINETAMLIKQSGVVGLPYLQLSGVVSRDVIDQFACFRPTDLNLAHMADIEDPGCRANGVVFL